MAAAFAAALLVLVIMLATGRIAFPGESAGAGRWTTTAPVADPTTPVESTEPAEADDVHSLPLTVSDSATLTVPQDADTAEQSFDLAGGGNYVVTLDVSTVKPADSLGVNIFFGARVTCSDGTEGGTYTAGGAENLLTGVPVRFSNQILLSPEEDATFTCSVYLNAPNDNGASKGTSFDIDVQWGVSQVEGYAFQVPASDRLPMVVATGSQALAFGKAVSIDSLTSNRVHIMTTLNVTTCSDEGGSTENGTTWCTEDGIDIQGSDFDVETRMDVLALDGTVCQTLGVNERTISLNTYRHHQTLSMETGLTIPDDLCGRQIRYATVIVNRGPAALLVHQANSSMVITESDVDR
ncbi:hypothetical protein ACXET9_09380 [Brachybacterium sp. DNPG3]